MRLFSMAIGLAALTGIVSADTITLKSGRGIQGTYLGGTARQVKVEIDTQSQTLNVNDVSRIEFSESRASSLNQACQIWSVHPGISLDDTRGKIHGYAMDYRGLRQGEQVYFIDAGVCRAFLAFSDRDGKLDSINYDEGGYTAAEVRDKTQGSTLLPPSASNSTSNFHEPTSGRAAQPALTVNEIQNLTEQRRYDADMISAVDGILNASSVSQRAQIYCRFTIDQIQSLTASTDSGKTSSDRQVQDYAYRASIDRCKAMVLTGYQRMPDPNELREKAAQAQQDITEVDRKLRAGQ
jgi:hypothetical protein